MNIETTIFLLASSALNLFLLLRIRAIEKQHRQENYNLVVRLVNEKAKHSLECFETFTGYARKWKARAKALETELAELKKEKQA